MSFLGPSHLSAEIRRGMKSSRETHTIIKNPDEVNMTYAAQ
jgi:hypothetical protein